MGSRVTSCPLTFEEDLPRLRGDHPDGHAERGRLAGAVAPQQPDHLAGVDLDADAVHDPPAAVGLHEISGAQQGHERAV
jgi:hypothetical protein